MWDFSKTRLLPPGQGDHPASARRPATAPAQLSVQRLTATRLLAAQIKSLWQRFPSLWAGLSLAGCWNNPTIVLTRQDSGLIAFWYKESCKCLYFQTMTCSFHQALLIFIVTVDMTPAFQTEHVFFHTYFLVTTQKLCVPWVWQREVAVYSVWTYLTSTAL